MAMVKRLLASMSKAFTAAVLVAVGATAVLQVVTETPTAASGSVFITVQPVSQSVSLGQRVTFTAAARGYPTPTVEWQVSVDGGRSWIGVAALNTPTISGVPTLFVNGWKLRAEFINPGGFAITRAVTLSVHGPRHRSGHSYPPRKRDHHRAGRSHFHLSGRRRPHFYR